MPMPAALVSMPMSSYAYLSYAMLLLPNIRLGLSIPSVFLPICLSVLVECFPIGTQSNDQTVETSGLEREGATEGKGLERDKLDGEGLKGFVCINLPSLTVIPVALFFS